MPRRWSPISKSLKPIRNKVPAITGPTEKPKAPFLRVIMPERVSGRVRVIQPMTLLSLGHYSEPEGVFLPSILY